LEGENGVISGGKASVAGL